MRRTTLREWRFVKPARRPTPKSSKTEQRVIKTVTFLGKFWNDRPLESLPFIKYFPKDYEYVLNPRGDYIFVYPDYDSIRSFSRIAGHQQVRVFWAAEANFPDFNIFDFAIGHDFLELDERYVRLHPMVMFRDVLKNGTYLDHVCDSHERPNFCDFIYSNRRSHPMRDHLFHELGKYRPVASYGAHLNNMGFSQIRTDWNSDWIRQKIGLQELSKFSIAAENAHYRGYTSEKIISSLIAGSIPIYWGNDRVNLDFNASRIVDVHSFDDLDELVMRVKEIDENDSLFQSIAREPWMTAMQEYALRQSEASLRDFFSRVFSHTPRDIPKRPVGTLPDRYEHDYLSRAKRTRQPLLTKAKSIAKPWLLKARRFL